MEQTKEQFIAQYWGQEVLISNHPVGYDSIESAFEIGALYLSLRSVSQLTDEEKIEVAKIVCQRHNRHYQPEDITYKVKDKKPYEVVLIIKGSARYIVQITIDGIAFIDYYLGGAGEQHYYCPGQYEATQYLISIGICLSDEAVKNGWVRIREDEKPVSKIFGQGGVRKLKED